MNDKLLMNYCLKLLMSLNLQFYHGLHYYATTIDI